MKPNHWMKPKKDGTQKPHWKWFLRMRCPYCGKTPLMASWFRFKQGCRPCDFRYEREIGYFMGASWMVTFPLVSLIAFIMAALLLIYFPDVNGLLVAAICSVTMIAVGILVTPFAMGLWLYLEHGLHPLDQDDGYDKELVN